jgi:PAS domain S-box-containing protein
MQPPRPRSISLLAAGILLFFLHAGIILFIGSSWHGAFLSNLIQLLLGILTVAATWQAARRCRGLGKYFWILAAFSYGIWVVAQAIGTYGESFQPGFGHSLDTFLFFCWLVPIGLALTLPQDFEAEGFGWLRFVDALQVVLFWTAAFLSFQSTLNSANGQPTPILYSVCYGVLTAAFFLRAWTMGSGVGRALLNRAGVFLLVSQGITTLFEFGGGKDLPSGAWFDLLWSFSVLISLAAATQWNETKFSSEVRPVSTRVNFQVAAELFSLLYPLLTFVIISPILHSRSEIGSAILLLSLACTATRLLVTQRNLVMAKEALREDLCRQQKTERALRESEQRFRGAFDFAAIGMAIVALDGRWLRVNQSLCTSLGYSSEELLAIDYQSITHPEDLEMDMLVGSKLIEGSLPFILIEKRFIHKNGKSVWVMVTVSMVCDAQGQPMYSVAQIQDITKRKEAEEAQRHSEERFAKIFRSNPEGIVLSTLTEGRILEVNDSYVRLMGYSRNEMVGKTVYELGAWNPGEREKILEKLKNQEEIRDYESTFHIAEGKTIQARVSMELIQVNHKPCLLTCVRDVTESRLLEHRLRAAQKMEAVGRLAGGVAHDFNNLLMIISGSAQLMKNRLPASDANARYIDQIESAAEKGAALTQQLLAFGRKQVLRPVVLNLNVVISDMWRLLPRLLGEDVETVLNLAPDLANVSADRSQIEQVIMNLSVNGRDAMPKGGKLVVETANVELDEAVTSRHGTSVPPGSYVMLSVTDTGTGMDANTQAKIFEPFFTTKELGKGTGLGLATVYGIVKQSGGYVWVYSEVGKGTSFKVYLPVEAKDSRAELEPETIEPQGTSTETVLLVDDNVELRQLAASFLGSRGYKVLEAGNHDEALDFCRKHPGTIHVMLTDIVLPGGGGPDLAKAALEIRPNLRMIYMSGYTDRVLGLDLAGANAAFLQKPFRLDALARALCSAVNSPAAI